MKDNIIVNSNTDGAIKGTITQENNRIYDPVAYSLIQVYGQELINYILDKIKEQQNKIDELNN